MTFAVPDQRKTIGGVLFAECDETFTTPVNAATNTTVFDARAFHKKIIYLKNTTDQSVVFTIQSLDDEAASGDDIRTIGSTVTLSAGNVTAQYDEIHISDYHPYIRVKIDPASDTASGAVTVKLRAQRGGGS